MDDGRDFHLDPASMLAAAMDALAGRLAAEIALTRAIRGTQRQESFLGLVMDDEEADAVCAELTGRIEAGDLPGRDQIESHWDEIRVLRQHNPDSIWARLAFGFQLTEIELDLIMLAAAPALDPRFGRIYGYLNDDMARRHLTPALALRLLGPRGLDTVSLHRLLSPAAPLRLFAILDLEPARPFIERPLRLDDRLATRLLGDEAGLDELRDRIAVLPPRGPTAACLTPPTWLADTTQRDPGPHLLSLADQNRWALAIISLKGVEAGARADVLALALREARLMRALPVILQAGAPDGPLAALISTGAALITHTPGGWMEAGLKASALPDIERGDITRRSDWLETLFRDDPRQDVLARAEHMALMDLLILAFQCDSAPVLAQRIETGRLGAFGPLARVSRPDTRLDDMVLNTRTRALLTDFIEHRRSAVRVLHEWGLGPRFGKTQGAAALFRGPPGTGKTMAASAVASALDRHLVRIDLSALVSKYIGETEKNLEQVFSAAEVSQALLFFDEADALFGQRSEVSDAHDRYANLETSYLLQRLETFSGVTILASNLHQNIDDAFLRRLDQIVDFPAPGRAERLALWQRIVTTKAPIGEDVDMESLAQRFELTGGEIRNCWLDAAYGAARAETPITMALLIEAVARELVKQGRPIRRSEFGDHFAKVRTGAGP